MGGLIAIGFDLYDLVYLEIEYNPSITSSVNDEAQQIKDNCWEVKMGVNINKLKTK
jgi:preprotein translocase subunit SecB